MLGRKFSGPTEITFALDYTQTPTIPVWLQKAADEVGLKITIQPPADGADALIGAGGTDERYLPGLYC